MGIAIGGITSESGQQWAKGLWRWSGRDGIVNYWMDDTKGVFGEKISLSEQRFIRRTFSTIDEITGLKFKRLERFSEHNTDIAIFSADSLGTDRNGNILTGYSIPREGRGQGSKWFEVVWVNRGGKKLTKTEEYVITHELGHVIGLDHPYGNGFNPRYDILDTVMSYNTDEKLRSFKGFTASDIRALESRLLWSSTDLPLG